MRIRSLVLAVVFAVVLVVTGCAGKPDAPDTVTPPADNGASGTRLAAGLYDVEGGKVHAVGTLAYVELEGGFWAITGATEANDDPDAVIAVIANADEFADEFESLEGKTVFAVGTRSDGASIRMAGPEIIIESIQEMSDTPGPAE